MQREPEKRRAVAGRASDDSSRTAGQRRPAAPLGEDPGSDADAACRRIADYLLDLAREGEVEPALGSLIEALDRGMRDFEVDARVRAQHIIDKLQERRIAARGHRAAGQGCDPYYWG